MHEAMKSIGNDRRDNDLSTLQPCDDSMFPWISAVEKNLLPGYQDDATHRMHDPASTPRI